eukprot:Gb_09742 [translate_table: standard]
MEVNACSRTAHSHSSPDSLEYFLNHTRASLPWRKGGPTRPLPPLIQSLVSSLILSNP